MEDFELIMKKKWAAQHFLKKLLNYLTMVLNNFIP